MSAEDAVEPGSPEALHPDITTHDRTASQFAFDAVRGTLGVSSDVDSCVQLPTGIDALMSQAIEYFR